MGFVTRAEQDSECHGAVRLTEIIKARETRIDELVADNALIRQEIVDVNANFAAIRESNERLRLTRDSLNAEMSRLQHEIVLLKQAAEETEKVVEGAKADAQYWVNQYQYEQAKAATYEKVIRMLAGKE